MKKDKRNIKQPAKTQTKPAQTSSVAVLENKYFGVAGLLGIILLGILIYSNSFDCSFHFDDIPNIVENPAIRNVADVQTWWNANPNRAIPVFTFALNYHFHQFDVRYWHYFNLGVHLINACLVWWLVGLLFAAPALQDAPLRKYRKEIAFFTALLFVSHPLATQSVTYIVQRMASMAALFYLLTIGLYLKGRLTQTASKYLFFAGGALSAGLAVFSKENAFTLPLALVLVEICFLQTRKFSLDFKDYRLLLALAALLAVFITVPLKFSFSIFNSIPPAHGHTYTVTPLNYLFTQFSVIPKYIQLLFLPLKQNLDYDYPISNSFFEARTILGFLLLGSLVGLAIYLFNRNRILAFGIFWFFITVSVESSIIPIEDLIFEHRTYLPSFGFLLLLTVAVYSLAGKTNKTLAMAVLLLTAGAYAIRTYQRNKVWQNDLTLWSDTVKKSPGKARPFGSRGDYYRDNNQPENALADYSSAIRNNPNYATALHNRGTVYASLNQWDKAQADYTRAIEIDPNYVKAYYNRGNAFLNLGDYARALADFSKALEDESTKTNAHLGRGAAYTRMQQWENAIKAYSEVLVLDPKYADAYYFRAAAHNNLRQLENTVSDYSSYLAINTQNKLAWYNRGVAYAGLKQWDKAIADYSQAIELDPAYVVAHINRGVAYGNLGQWDKALANYNNALAIAPDNPIARGNRDIAYRNVNSRSK